jgi:hypothetical protein
MARPPPSFPYFIILVTLIDIVVIDITGRIKATSNVELEERWIYAIEHDRLPSCSDR